MNSPDPEELDGKAAKYCATVSQKTKEVAELLAQLLSHNPPAAVLSVRERLYSLKQGSLGEANPAIFSELCAAARDAFPEETLSDAEILANAATPDLVRYLLASLRRFSESKQTPSALSPAFLASRPKRGKPGKLERLGPAMVSAAFEARRNTRGAPSAGYKAAVEAAYAVYRQGEKGDQQEGVYQKTLRDIKALLRRSGMQDPDVLDRNG
jgi:hypothetical protein